MRYFRDAKGDTFGARDDVVIAEMLASGMAEVACMHPDAQEIVWRRPDSTISVTMVMPDTLASFEFARTHLALNKLAAADAVGTTQGALGAADAALAEADALVRQGREASKLRIQVQAQIQGVRDLASQQLAELQREAFAVGAAIGQRDAELVAMEKAGVQAQALLSTQQARDQAAASAATSARADIDLQTAAIAQADQQMAALQAALADGTAGETAAADLAAALAARQAADAALTSARQALNDAERVMADAGSVMAGLQQVISQANGATAERVVLVEQRQARGAQDAAAADAIRTSTDQAVYDLQQQDAQLAALEVAATRTENNLPAMQADRESKIAALAAAEKLVADIARAEQLAATEGVTIEEHAQRLQARGAVPADWTVHAVHASEAAWRPAGVELDDLVIDAQGALVADQAKVLARAARKFEAFVQGVLDRGAQDVGYDNIVSACSYAAAPNPFQAESTSFVTWRGAVWAKCYEVLAAVQAGTRAVPTEAELLAELPVRGV